MQYLYAYPIWTALIGAVLLALLILATTSATYHVTGFLDYHVWQPGLKALARRMDVTAKWLCRVARRVDDACRCVKAGAPSSVKAECRSIQTRTADRLFMLADRLDYMLYRPLAHANGCWSYAEEDAFLSRLGDVPPHPSVAHPDNPWLYAGEEA